MASTNVDGVHIPYLDSGGKGPTIVMLHGIHMNADIWRSVFLELETEYRCIAPTLPLGAHPQPVPMDADLTLDGLATLVARFLEQIGVSKPTLVGNDTGGAILQALVGRHREVIDRLALVSCEAYDNMPPGLPGAVDRLAVSLPGGIGMAAQSMRIPGFSSLPIAFGRMSEQPIPKDLLRMWFEPLRRDRDTRRNFASLVRGLTQDDMQAASAAVASWRGPAAVIWGERDTVMPRAHGQRLADTLNVDLTIVANSSTLIPLDQPTALAQAIRRLQNA